MCCKSFLSPFRAQAKDVHSRHEADFYKFDRFISSVAMAIVEFLFKIFFKKVDPVLWRQIIKKVSKVLFAGSIFQRMDLYVFISFSATVDAIKLLFAKS